ncbi:transcriptional regulator, AlpA family [Rhodanobacter sp. OK091]|nr:transcriptional regulator, AlpA family [Rhodanobacter sp. OK091]
MCKNGQTWQAATFRGESNNMAGSDGEILTLDEVAAFLKAGKRTVYRLAQNGQIPAFKLGGTWRFRRSELDSWIDANSNQRKPIGKAQR